MPIYYFHVMLVSLLHFHFILLASQSFPLCPSCISIVLIPSCVYSSVGFISLISSLDSPSHWAIQYQWLKVRSLKSEFDITYQNINRIKLLDFWHFAFILSKMRAFIL